MSEKPRLVIDTSVVLNFFERVTSFREILQDFLFDNYEVFVPESVIKEATSSSKSSITMREITSKCKALVPDYDKHDPEFLSELGDRIDRGETDVILCAIELNCSISTDDLAAIKIAKQHDLLNFGTIAILKQAYDEGELSPEEIGSVISEIQSKGGRFKNIKGMTFEEYYQQYLK